MLLHKFIGQAVYNKHLKVVTYIWLLLKYYTNCMSTPQLFRESTDSDPRDTRKCGTLEWNFSLWSAVGSMYMTSVCLGGFT